MERAPESIVLERDRDLVGREHELWVRRLLFALLCAVAVLALFNVFGQRPSTSHAALAAATLDVSAPARVRGGLLYDARFQIVAHRDLEKALLVLDQGWAEGMIVNAIQPQPVNEASHNGSLVLELGHIARGSSYVLFVGFQVVPTNVGRRAQNVELFDGSEKLIELHRTLTVFP